MPDAWLRLRFRMPDKPFGGQQHSETVSSGGFSYMHMRHCCAVLHMDACCVTAPFLSADVGTARAVGILTVRIDIGDVTNGRYTPCCAAALARQAARL